MKNCVVEGAVYRYYRFETVLLPFGREIRELPANATSLSTHRPINYSPPQLVRLAPEVPRREAAVAVRNNLSPGAGLSLRVPVIPFRYVGKLNFYSLKLPRSPDKNRRGARSRLARPVIYILSNCNAPGTRSVR